MLNRFSGKRILITGNTGFKGSWLTLWLHELGAKLFGLALPPYSPEELYSLAGLSSLIDHANQDIIAGDQVLDQFERIRPEIVFHLAAQPLVRLSYAEPKRTFDTNVGGSVNILEAVRRTDSVRALVFVTSDKCYRNREWVWGYREQDELGGHDPYSASKAAAEVVFSSYCDSFFAARPGFGAASVRAGNVIGGGDWAVDRIVPDSIRFLEAKEPVILRNPASTRPWQHVLDPLSGYLALAEKLIEDPKSFTGAWNFGPGMQSNRTVQELAETIVRYWGTGVVECNKEKHSLHEASVLHLNCDKATTRLGWRPLWGFDRSVYETTEWYRRCRSGQGARRYSQEQIIRYMNERREEDERQSCEAVAHD